MNRYYSTDEAGTKLMTEANLANALSDGYTVSIQTEIETLNLKSGSKPFTATDGKSVYTIGELRMFYGSYHQQFGNVFYPTNINQF